VDKETYTWFRLGSRPDRPSDRLGPYKLMPLEGGVFEIDEDDQQNLRRYLNIDGKRWNDEGSVVVDCFQWRSEVKCTSCCTDVP